LTWPTACFLKEVRNKKTDYLFFESDKTTELQVTAKQID
jgi:hypothetical protein